MGQRVASLSEELEQCKQSMDEQKVQFETRMEQRQCSHNDELANMKAHHKVEVNRLTLQKRKVQQELEDYKMDTERRRKEEACNTWLIARELVRENEALKNQVIVCVCMRV